MRSSLYGIPYLVVLAPLGIERMRGRERENATDFFIIHDGGIEWRVATLQKATRYL